MRRLPSSTRPKTKPHVRVVARSAQTWSKQTFEHVQPKLAITPYTVTPSPHQTRTTAFRLAQMRGQFRTQQPLHELDLQHFHSPGIAEQVFRALIQK